MVLHTDSHSNTAHVLNDESFWRGLDERSGQRWPVFAMRAIPGKTVTPNARPGDLSLMVAVYREPKENKEILDALGLDSSERPYLVVCSLLNDEEMLVQSVALSEESLEAAHKALKEGLDAATTAIEDLTPERIKSAQSVYNAVELTFTDLKHKRLIKKAVPLLGLLKKLFSQVSAP
jgi:hypothetical protein